jgi:2',3'-cyclic-nucleotide 2'-phosphodiesterase (5'-nucleotidase family)
MECTMDNLLLQAIQRHTGAELAFSNGWRYGAPIPRGPVTVGDLWQIIPVNPPVSVCDITGREVWDMMEMNLERTFARDPYRQMGGYVKRCMGLNLYFKVENPEGKRVNRLFINGKPFDPEKTYRACYVTRQGVRPGFGSNKEDLDVRAVDVLRRYVEDEKRVSAPLRNTVVPI